MIMDLTPSEKKNRNVKIGVSLYSQRQAEKREIMLFAHHYTSRSFCSWTRLCVQWLHVCERPSVFQHLLPSNYQTHEKSDVREINSCFPPSPWSLQTLVHAACVILYRPFERKHLCGYCRITWQNVQSPNQRDSSSIQTVPTPLWERYRRILNLKYVFTYAFQSK